MNDRDQQILESFLKGLQVHLQHLAIDKQYEILEMIRTEVKELQAQSGKSVEAVLLPYKNPQDLLNRMLAKQGLEAITIKPSTDSRKIALSVAGGVLCLFIGFLVFLYMKLTPIFEVDPIDGTLTILGQKLEQEESTYFQNNRNFSFIKHSKIERKITHKGAIPMLPGQRLRLEGEEVDLLFRVHELNEFHFDCKSNQGSDEFMRTEGDRVLVEMHGSTQCHLTLPPEIDFEGDFSNGIVNLADLKQNFKIELENGVVTWKQADQASYQGQFEVENGNIYKERDKFEAAAQWKATIEVENGEIRLR